MDVKQIQFAQEKGKQVKVNLWAGSHPVYTFPFHGCSKLEKFSELKAKEYLAVQDWKNIFKRATLSRDLLRSRQVTH